MDYVVIVLSTVRVRHKIQCKSKSIKPNFSYTVVELEQANSRSGMMSRTHLHFKNSYGDRLLESVAVKLYNNLPEALRNEDILPCFKNNLLKHVLAAQHK